MDAAVTDPLAAHVPAHVPRALAFPIGVCHGAAYLADPYGLMAGFHRTHPPVFYSAGPEGVNQWLATKHADCLRVLRDTALFANAGGSAFPRDPDDWFDLIPVEIEPPAHRKYRAILDGRFTPRGIGALEAEIRGLAASLIEGFADRGHCDFAEAFSRPLPVSVFLGLMGLPLDMRDTFVGWAMDLLHSQDDARVRRAIADIGAYLDGAIAGKRAAPDGSALSRIVHGEIDGQPLSHKEMFGYAFFVFVAGLDTVYAALNNIFLWLARNPDRRREIREPPDNIDNVVEELLRLFTVTFSGRQALRDTEVHGVPIRAGDRVLCVLPAANYDPDVFPDPERADFHRPRKPILAFSAGAHACLGAHLARLEVKICLQEFLRRIPDFGVSEGSAIRYLPGGVVGPEGLGLSW